MSLRLPIRAICFDWGGTLMSEAIGAADLPMAQWSNVAATEGIASCLQALQTDYTLCVATNASVSGASLVRSALARVQLDGYFDYYFCAADLGYRKDQKEFWQTVTTKLRLLPHEILMVGDSLTQDVLAPQQFGIQTVWFNPTAQATLIKKEVLSVRDWSEFGHLLQNT